MVLTGTPYPESWPFAHERAAEKIGGATFRHTDLVERPVAGRIGLACSDVGLDCWTPPAK